MTRSVRPRTPFAVLIALICAGCGGQTVNPSAPTLPTATSAALPSPTTAVATSSPVATAAAAPSPTASLSAAGLDGQIVFEDAGQDFELSQIWIENADGSGVHKVVSDQFTDNSASLSPDGRSI